MFAIIFGLMFFKGMLASLAGPAPNYDMQRILATRNPREACMMNGMVNVVLYFPRYMMITGLTVLALAFCMPELRGHGQAGLREAAADRADAVRAGRRGWFPAGRTAGGVHVQFRRHDQRRARPTSSTTSTSASSTRIRSPRTHVCDEPRGFDRRADGRASYSGC